MTWTGISWGCHLWPLPSAALEESGEDTEADGDRQSREGVPLTLSLRSILSPPRLSTCLSLGAARQIGNPSILSPGLLDERPLLPLLGCRLLESEHMMVIPLILRAVPAMLVTEFRT